MQERNSRGSLFIISAPSGTGKTTLCKKLVSSLPDLKFSVSYTTRHPRPGEVHTRDYSFVSRNDFMSMVDRKEFLEWAEIYGDFYGTSKKKVEELKASGFDVILDIDTQGAMQIKKKYRAGTYIFILPPSPEILKERLEKRMTNSKEEIKKRLKSAVSEIKSYKKYDYVIINDVFESALRELEAIIISCRLSTKIITPLWIKERFKTGSYIAKGG